MTLKDNKVCNPKIRLFGGIDYFWMVIFKVQETQEEPLTFPLTAKRIQDRRPIPRLGKTLIAVHPLSNFG